ncbi:DUF1876 domain-containing protein [Actinomadura craniellae]|uniref:DUF1876 domain-containing protein n=1 Tax=Actinomadura craniellae TaxID=2231787 RepID=A0A365H3U7_9ACTN|nr:DUF1876 domain-containing protein [Actinomadura craniellae]RAY13780.1 DUF1876 domain-containing protein [Actinomadura craniellae]
MKAKDWTIQIHISEEDPTTVARAVLSTDGTMRATGVGRARRNPADREVPEIGDELAVARALADLAGRLQSVAGQDIAQFTGSAST